MTPEELYWLAGYLEGEGSFLSEKHHQGPWLKVRIGCGSIDYDITEKAAQLMGGRIYGPYKATLKGKVRENCQDYYEVRLQAKEKVIALCKELQPLMGTRRQKQIQVVLDAYHKYINRNAQPV